MERQCHGYGCSTRLPWANYMSNSAVFKGLKAEKLNYDKIDLLVSNNLEELFWPLEGKENRLVDDKGVQAVNTKLGFTFAGPLKAVACQGTTAT